MARRSTVAWMADSTVQPVSHVSYSNGTYRILRIPLSFNMCPNTLRFEIEPVVPVRFWVVVVLCPILNSVPVLSAYRNLTEFPYQ